MDLPQSGLAEDDASTTSFDSLISPLLGSESSLAPPIDTDRCALLGGFSLVVQLAMGLIVLGTLLLKRTRERPKRKWRVWAADVSKQVIGQAFVHSLNVGLSEGLANESTNPCSLYALNIVLDTTVGVAILYGILILLTRLASSVDPSAFQTGDYGTPFSFAIWAKQAAVYVGAITGMKLAVVGTLWLLPGLFSLTTWALGHLDTKTQVVIVVLILPCVMNVVQFLIVDSFLKFKPDSVELGDSGSSSGGEDGRHGRAERGRFLDDVDGIGGGHDGDDDEDRVLYEYDEDADEVRSSDMRPQNSRRGTARTGGGSSEDEHSYPPSMTTTVSSAARSGARESKAGAIRLGTWSPPKRMSSPPTVEVTRPSMDGSLGGRTSRSSFDDWDDEGRPSGAPAGEGTAGAGSTSVAPAEDADETDSHGWGLDDEEDEEAREQEHDVPLGATLSEKAAADEPRIERVKAA